MLGAGLEPAQDCSRGILSPLCLPFHHPSEKDTHKIITLGLICKPNVTSFFYVILYFPQMKVGFEKNFLHLRFFPKKALKAYLEP